MIKSRITTIATHLPTQIVSNADLEAENPGWKMDAIAARAGVNSRHIAAAGETAFDLTKAACEKLPREAIERVDAIIYCTQSPDFIMPPNAHLLHAHLDLRDEVAAFDINLACSGFVYGLGIAHSMISAGTARNVLLATADTYSRYIHPKDRSARVLFGDGAAVSLIEASPDDHGFSSFALASHGKEYAKFHIQAGGLRRPKSEETARETTDRGGNVRSADFIEMDGLAVWSFINSAVPKQISTYLGQNGLGLSDIDCFIFHQASRLTLDSLVKVLGIDYSKVHLNLASVGNTVSASIPMCLADAVRQGRVQAGDRVLVSGFGVGLSYATTSFEYRGEIDVR